MLISSLLQASPRTLWWRNLEEDSSDDTYDPDNEEEALSESEEEDEDEAQETEDEAQETEDEAQETEDEVQETEDGARWETEDEAEMTGEEGDGAFHCHMLYHMHAGMMRVVQVRKAGAAA